MTKPIKRESQLRTRARVARKRADAKKVAEPSPVPPSPKRPGGKLGLILERREDETGATLKDLAAATSWLPHTVRAAVCRLGQRGFGIRLEERDGRKAYRLAVAEG